MPKKKMETGMSDQQGVGNGIASTVLAVNVEQNNGGRNAGGIANRIALHPLFALAPGG
jgi:hypothetical protein